MNLPLEDQRERAGGPATWYRSQRALTAAVGVIVGAVFISLVSDMALGWDESVYLVKARSWIEGTPDSGYGIYRPIGMPIAAWAGLMMGLDVAGLRLVAALVAIATIVILWLLGRTLLSPAAGLATAGIVGFAPSYLLRVPDFLNDIATTGAVLLVILLLWRHFERVTRWRWEIVLAAPIAALAFYLRYGVIAALVVVAVVGGVVWRNSLLHSRNELAATTGVFALLVIPHLVYAWSTTGSVLGVLFRASDEAGRQYLGEGLVSYLSWLPNLLAGPLGGVVMALGFVSAALAVRRGGLRTDAPQHQRAAVLLGGIGMGHLLLTGLMVHAEVRYVFLSIMCLALIGSQFVIELAKVLFRDHRRTAIAILVAALVIVSAANVLRVRSTFDDLAFNLQLIEQTGIAIAEEAESGDCRVTTSYVPLITWYSKCESIPFDSGRPLAYEEGVSQYVLLFERGIRQRDVDSLVSDDNAVVLAPRFNVDGNETRLGDAYLYEILPAP